MIPENGLIKDISDNGNDGTITGGCSYVNTPFGPGMRFNGVDGYINLGTAFNSLTSVALSMWVKFNDVTTAGYLFNKFLGTTDAWGVLVQSGNIRILDDIDNANAFLYDTAVAINQWYHVVAVLNASLENKLYLNSTLVGSGTTSTANWDSFAGNLYLGQRQPAGNLLNCEIVNGVVVLNQEPDLAWVQKQYSRGKTALWSSAFGAHESSAATTSGPLENLPLYVDSGSFKCAQATINGIPGISVKCVSAGTLSVPTSYFRQTATEAAYGKWEWWMRKGSGLNTIRIYFINTSGDISATPTGYNFQFTADERAKIEETGVGNQFESATGYISINTWYKCTVTRDGEDEFTGYLNDELITASGGTNPFTDTSVVLSNYFLINMDATDEFFWADPYGRYNFIKRLLA
jgi:hypothetical protein